MDDVRDRIEDIRDRRNGNNGVRDRIEDVRDRREDVRDQREDVADRSENRGCAMNVHRWLGPGVLETVYSRALAFEIGEMGLAMECGKKIQVRYKGAIVGDLFADMVVCDSILIENKAVQALVRGHEAQLVNYLTATGVEIGLLLNFGAERLQFKRRTLGYRSIAARQDGEDLGDKRG